MVTMTAAECAALLAKAAECDRLTALINTPELVDFSKAVAIEAAHQRERWGSDHDEGKTPADWFWLVGHLGTRALASHAEAERLAARRSDDPNGFIAGDIAHHRRKAIHHTITAAAALANWHAAMLGKTNMRPGIDPAQHGLTP